MTSPAMAWAAVRRVLCVRLDTIGDVLMTTPAIRAVRESAADRAVTLLTSPSGASIARLVPVIDDVLVYEAPWLKATAPRLDAELDIAMIDELRSRAFDAAIVFTVFSQSALPAALLCYLADIPLRLAHARENPYQMLSTWIPDPEPETGIRHEVERQLALVEKVGCRTSNTSLALQVPVESRRRVQHLLESYTLGPGRPWVLVHPGATAASRRYPPDRFGAAVRQIARATGAAALVTGDGSERDLVDEVCRSAGGAVHPLAGSLSLADMAALVDAAPLLITNNTGPAHMAAALGTPVVDLYALTNPQHTPWQVPSRVLSHDVPCRNCFKSVCPAGHHACLLGISPADVALAALELLRQPRALAPRLSA
jgi:lipopolysaccharide heptosyltransferase II